MGKGLRQASGRESPRQRVCGYLHPERRRPPGHGSTDSLDVTIPWIAWGKGVEAGVVLEPGVRTMDTAATALWLLGVDAAAGSVGRAVAAAFQPEAMGTLVDAGAEPAIPVDAVTNPGG